MSLTPKEINEKSIEKNRLHKMRKNQFVDYVNRFLNNVNKNEELEVRFGTKGIKKITKIDFDNVIQYLKSKNFNLVNTEYTLKIQPEVIDKKSNLMKISGNIRVEVIGLQNIREFCNTNQLLDSTGNLKSKVRFLIKTPIKNVDGSMLKPIEFNDFNFRVSYQSEYETNTERSFIQDIVNNWNDRKKIYRMVTRYTFSNDTGYVVDMSIVRSSSIRENKGRYTVIPAYNLLEANVFNNPETYEIELELLNKDVKFGDVVLTNEDRYSELQKGIKYVLSALQQTNYPISYDEMKTVGIDYLQLIGKKISSEEQHKVRLLPQNFIGPSSISLEIKHIQEENPDSILPNIRKNYCVTDKADGIRKLLYINSKGRVYLIDMNMNIQFTGLISKSSSHFNSLLDGEHILHNKKGEFINLYALFDVYIVNGIDKRGFDFIKSYGEIVDDEKTKEYRYDILKNFINTINYELIAPGGKPLDLTVKEFYTSTSRNDNIFNNCYRLFQRMEHILDYNTDGIIFTPNNLPVGCDNKNETSPDYKKTWIYSLKWKPVEYNSIDFLVTTVKDETGKEVVKNIFESGIDATDNNQSKQYKELTLRVGYDERTHGYINPCKDLIDNKLPVKGQTDNNELYRPMPFIPTTPYDENAHKCNIMLKRDLINGDTFLFTEDGKETFEDETIVEFRYDKTKPGNWKWIPIRVRYDKTSEYRSGLKNYGNAYHVAESVWKSIHNPVTVEMLSSGKDIPEDYGDDDVYYNRVGKVDIAALRNFHNLYVKKLLINSVSSRGNTLYDLAVGKAGDLNKWVEAKLSFVFGVDVSKDNIENRKDGACARYLNVYKQNNNIPKAMFVNANSSLNIKSGEACFSEGGKQIVNAVFGKGSKDENKLGKGVFKLYGLGREGFDVVSCQFALHYFFENEDTLHNFIKNVAEGCKLGGYFIGTCYDGKKMFKELSKLKQDESLSKYENDEKIWEVTKKYDIDEFNNDVTCVGKRIDVYQNTINKVFPEYLVNFDYFTDLMRSYGFELLKDDEAKKLGLPNSSGMFEELYQQLKNNVKVEGKRGNNSLRNQIGNALELENNDIQKYISFLNRYFVYKKVNEVNLEYKGTVLKELEEKQKEEINEIIKTVESAGVAESKANEETESSKINKDTEQDVNEEIKETTQITPPVKILRRKGKTTLK